MPKTTIGLLTRFFRFRLSTFLVGFVILAIPMAWLAAQIHQYRWEQALIARITDPNLLPDARDNAIANGIDVSKSTFLASAIRSVGPRKIADSVSSPPTIEQAIEHYTSYADESRQRQSYGGGEQTIPASTPGGNRQWYPSTLPGGEQRLFDSGYC